MSMKNSTLLILLLILVTTTSQAQLRTHVSSDTRYYTFEDEWARYVYPIEYRHLLPQMIAYNQNLNEYYQQEFNWQLDQKPYYILFSSQNQIANGYATVMPEIHTGFYGSSFELLNEMSSSSWLNTLMIHETAHLYQTNVKQGYSKTLREIFGVSQLSGSSFLPPFTYTLHPNIFLPTLFLEGNATWNEGRFGNGGRLYNGAARSIFLQLLNEGKLTPERLINDHLQFPFGREKYLVGGFLFSSLAAQQGADKINRYFYNQAHFMFNPLVINEPFFLAYSKGYKQAFAEMKEPWGAEIRQIGGVPGDPIAHSLAHNGFTGDDNEVRFLISNLKSLPRAIILNKESRKIQIDSMNIPLGKLFKLSQDKYAVPATEKIKSNQSRTALFGKGYAFDDKSIDKFIFDLRGERILWTPTVSAFHEITLYDDNKPLGLTHSTPIYGEDGHVYYFRQNGKTRTLYQDEKAIFTFQGYYGHPVYGKNGVIYFIGPAEAGTTLYRWSNGAFAAVLPSHKIVDAYAITDTEFVIAEITTTGYEYRIAKINIQPANPIEFKFEFEKDTKFQLYLDKKLLPTLTTIEANEKPYTFWSDWRYKGTDPAFWFGADTPATAALVFHFSDVLGDHALNLMAQTGSYNEWSAGFQYVNLKSIFNWDVLSRFEKRSKLEETDSTEEKFRILDNYDNWLAAIGFNFDYFERPQFKSNLSSHFVYQHEQPHLVTNDIDQTFGFISSLDFTYKIRPPLAFSDFRKITLELSHEINRQVPHWSDPENIYGGELTLSQDIFRETYLTAAFQEAYTDARTPAIWLRRDPDDAPYPKAHNITRQTADITERFFELQKTQVQLKQALPFAYYFSRFPLSLRRLALFADYNYYAGAKNNNTTAQYLFYESGGGVEFELLFAHKFPLRLAIANYKNSRTEDSEAIVNMGLNQEF